MNDILDMSQFTAPKSDQINADDLIGGPLTITVTRVAANESSPEQPVTVCYEGDGGRPYKPCKSMRRVMMLIWGTKGSDYVGKSMTLYRDPKVQFGGMQLGGIRISHMTDIPVEKMSQGVAQLSLTMTRGKRAPYVVKELKVEPRKDEARAWADGFIAGIGKVPVADAIDPMVARAQKALDRLQAQRPELYAECQHAIDLRRAAFDPDHQEGRTTEQHGDQFDGSDFGEED